MCIIIIQLVIIHKTFNFKMRVSLLSHDFLKDRFTQDLPKTFSELKKKMYISGARITAYTRGVENIIIVNCSLLPTIYATNAEIAKAIDILR